MRLQTLHAHHRNTCPLTHPTTEGRPPHDHPITLDGAALLEEVEAFHRRFNVFPREAAYVAVALWDAHAHLIDASTPPPGWPSSPPNRDPARAVPWRSWRRWYPTG